ncbi:MAG: hypothetical protein OEU89_06865 [Burkholderiaceae bacterium]|jgi:hypothetical protein|nr:hypothetical protein [Burkholderiaceae bacterium]
MNTFGNSWRTRAASVMGSMMDRCFERLQRAQLIDVERSLASSANERELSQRVHRLTSGEFPLHA